MRRTLLQFTVFAVLSATAVAWGNIGGGPVVFSPSGAKRVVYSHDYHVSKAGLKCSDCHYRIFQMQAAPEKITMADMQHGEGCGACHDGKKAFDIKDNCARCHA